MLGFWGCASMDGDENGDNNGIVPKVDLSEALTKSLDSIFSDKNALAYNMKLDFSGYDTLFFVIDNPQEFLTVCDDAAISAQINFEKNSLIWGKFISPLDADEIVHSELLKIRKNVYTYEIVMKRCIEGCYATMGIDYFWSVHPKISNKNIQLITKDTNK
jgi:hypothetical protein